jgi:hypothetical protein
MRKVGALILLGLSVGACGVGEDDYVPPETDDRNEELGIICEARFDLSGTFVAGTPSRPAELSGCWPVGEWTFTAKLAENSCTTPEGGAATIATLPSYRFTVGRVEGADMQGYVDTYSWAGDMAAVRRLKVTAGGGGECEGGLELFSADGTQFWNMKPNQTGGVLTGTGEYALYNENAR